MADLLQFVMAGLAVGTVYGLVGLGFSVIYNATDVINFAQGEFVMLGGMAAVSLLGLGVPLPLAILIAILAVTIVGGLIEKVAIEPAAGSSVITLIIITIGLSILLRGVAQAIWGTDFHAIPAFSGTEPIIVYGVRIVPQALWVLGVSAILVLLLWLFFSRSRVGTAMRALSDNRVAAQVVGIDVKTIVVLSFALSAAIGAAAGILTAPLTLTAYDVGTMLGLKGFSAAILGGMGNPFGAMLGGLMLGLIETFAAGYISSAYKDAAAFLVILAVLLVRPTGLFGAAAAQRV